MVKSFFGDQSGNKERVKIKIFFILLIELLIMYPIIALGNDKTLENLGGSPEYYLQTNASKLQVGANDYLKLDIYFVGSGGPVNYSRIVVYIPRCIVKNQTIEYKALKYRSFDHTLSPYISPTLNIEPEFFDYIEYYFYEIPIVQGFVIGNSSELKSIYGQNVGAGDNRFEGEYHPPRSINFSISKDATPGDYEIVVYYFYKYLDKWYSDKNVVPLHVNYWYEETFYQDALSKGTLLTILLVAFELIIMAKRFLIWIWPKHWWQFWWRD